MVVTSHGDGYLEQPDMRVARVTIQVTGSVRAYDGNHSVKGWDGGPVGGGVRRRRASKEDLDLVAYLLL